MLGGAFSKSGQGVSVPNLVESRGSIGVCYILVQSFREKHNFNMFISAFRGSLFHR